MSAVNEEKSTLAPLDCTNDQQLDFVISLTPRDKRIIWWAFFVLWLGGTWPYQSILQAQSYYVKEFDANFLEFYVLMTFTWPLLLCHIAQVLSGAAKAAGFERRAYCGFAATFSIGAIFIAQDVCPDSLLPASTKQALIMGLAGITAAAQVAVEPALFGLAGLLPEAGGVQAMLLGNAFAGVASAAANAASLLAVGGDSSVSSLRSATRVFFSFSVFISCLCLLVFSRLVALESVQQAMRIAERSGRDKSLHQEDPTWRSRLQQLRRVARVVWKPAACQLLVYAVTLACWPSIPGGACPEGCDCVWQRPPVTGILLAGIFAEAADYYFTMIVAAYNLLDFASRCGLPWLQKVSNSLSGRTVVVLAVSRCLFIPAIYLCVKPRLVRGEFGNWSALLLVMALASSNGFLATVTMMQAPQMVVAEWREDAAYVMVTFIYLGLAIGCTSSYFIAKYAMHVPLDC